jgi:Domain of unknown function (DUF929)
MRWRNGFFRWALGLVLVVGAMLGFSASALAIATPPLTELKHARSNLSALVEAGDTKSKAALHAATADLSEATANSLWVSWADPSDAVAVPPPEGTAVFAKATAALKQLNRILNDRTVPEDALLEATAEIGEAEDDLAVIAAEEVPGFHAPPGTPAKKWQAALRELGKQITGSVTSVPQATLEAAARDYGEQLEEKSVELLTAPQAISGPPLTDEGKPEIFYYGAEGCPFCAIARWSMVAALAQFGKFSTLQPMVSSTTDLDPATHTLTFYKSKYKSSYLAFVPDEAFTNQPACETCFWTALQAPTPAQQELINSYDIVEYEGEIFHGFPFLDVANKWATISSTANPELLDEMSWQQIATVMRNAGSPVGQAIDGGAEIITAQICEADGEQPARICESAIVQSYREALKTGF